MRVTPETLAEWRAGARAEGVSLTEWLERSARQRIAYQGELLERLEAANALARAERREARAAKEALEKGQQ